MGTGIGLAVVRDLAVRHQGEARVERTETGGARLVVELPSGGRTPPKDSGHPGAAPPTRAAL
jgi:signal transduction histidine kinase